jgi:mRNA interferase HigB
MKIVSVKILREFWVLFPSAEQHLKAWVDEVKQADWNQPSDIKAKYRSASIIAGMVASVGALVSDIKAKYRSASILKNRRVVFNIKGNDYRLVVSVAYQFGAVYIKFIGTHAQYDAIDAETIE